MGRAGSGMERQVTTGFLGPSQEDHLLPGPGWPRGMQIRRPLYYLNRPFMNDNLLLKNF